MATFLVAHGAWSGGWSWKKMRPLLREQGHELFTPTYTGIGERIHLASPETGLETHITDILNVLQFEDLRNVYLIGHSYGGMVATSVADRVPERLAHIVYLDAFVPRHGQCLFDLRSAEAHGVTGETSRTAGDEWQIPPNPLPEDTSESDVAWIMPRRVTQPLKTFKEPVSLSGKGDHIPKTYVYCTRPGPVDVFRAFAEQARENHAWRYFEIDASHSPHITAPEALAALLDKIVTFP